MKSVWQVKAIGILIGVASLAVLAIGVHAQEQVEALDMREHEAEALEGWGEDQYDLDVPSGTRYALLVTSTGKHQFTLRDQANDEAIAMALGPISNAIFCVKDNPDTYYLDVTNQSDDAFDYEVIVVDFDQFCNWPGAGAISTSTGRSIGRGNGAVGMAGKLVTALDDAVNSGDDDSTIGGGDDDGENRSGNTTILALSIGANIADLVTANINALITNNGVMVDVNARAADLVNANVDAGITNNGLSVDVNANATNLVTQDTNATLSNNGLTVTNDTNAAGLVTNDTNAAVNSQGISVNADTNALNIPVQVDASVNDQGIGANVNAGPVQICVPILGHTCP